MLGEGTSTVRPALFLCAEIAGLCAEVCRACEASAALERARPLTLRLAGGKRVEASVDRWEAGKRVSVQQCFPGALQSVLQDRGRVRRVHLARRTIGMAMRTVRYS